ncbi:hypothetical protein PMIN04_004374 [Paraphaeosphaeria minitans]
MALECTLAKHVVLRCCTSHNMAGRGPFVYVPNNPMTSTYGYSVSTNIWKRCQGLSSGITMSEWEPLYSGMDNTYYATLPLCGIPRSASDFAERIFQVIW